MSDQIITLLGDLVEDEVLPVGIPKLRLPFAMSADADGVLSADTVEQDTQGEIAQCVYAVAATRLGEHPIEPDFGVEDLAFRDPAGNVEELRSAVEQWEPRAEAAFDSDLDGTVQRIATAVEVRQ